MLNSKKTDGNALPDTRIKGPNPSTLTAFFLPVLCLALVALALLVAVILATRYRNFDNSALWFTASCATMISGALMAFLNSTFNDLDLDKEGLPPPDDRLFRLRIRYVKRCIDLDGIFAFALSAPTVLSKIYPDALIAPGKPGAILSERQYYWVELGLGFALALGLLVAAYLAIMKFRISRAEFLYEQKVSLNRPTGPDSAISGKSGDVMPTDYDIIRNHLAMMLRDHPPGTSADLTDQTVAFWDGHQVLGMYLCADEPGLDEEFELSDEFLGDISEAVDSWVARPSFTFRPELLEWLKDAPPFDASV